MKTQAQVIAEHAAAAAKKIRHQKFYWCRLWNGFLDMPLWRVIAADAGVHLTVVQAFVTRLDSFANEQTPRGDVTYFNPTEFGTALDIPVESAARLFAALERREWIEQDHLTSFYTRNRDSDRDVKPTTDAERKQRERTFKAALRELVRQKNFGLITAAELTGKQIALDELRSQGRRGAVTWEEQRVELNALLKVPAAKIPAVKVPPELARHDSIVTGGGGAAGRHPGASAGRQTTKADVTTDRDAVAAAPTRHDAIVTWAVDETAQVSDGEQKIFRRDIRDSHARSDQTFTEAAVDNCGAAACGETAGLSEEETAGAETGEEGEAQRWLASEGRTLLIEKLREPPGQVDMLCGHWLEIAGRDHAALAAVIRSAVARAGLVREFRAADLAGLIEGDVCRYRERQRGLAHGPPLPLKTLLTGGAAGSVVTSKRDGAAEHGGEGDVTADRDDDLKKAAG